MKARATDEEILQLLRAGATHNQIREQLGFRNPNRITRLRHEHRIPVPVRERPGRTPEQTYALHTRHDDDGHARWAGAWSGRMPAVHLPGTGKRKTSALRVAFRMLHNREPEGRVRPVCGQPWCIAAQHLGDRRTRADNTPAPLTTAIERMIENGISEWQIVRRLGTSTQAISRVRQTLHPAGGQQ